MQWRLKENSVQIEIRRLYCTKQTEQMANYKLLMCDSYVDRIERYMSPDENSRLFHWNTGHSSCQRALRRRQRW